MALRISIAMCTRNAAPYLPAQLASILRQTRLPDELVVGDEASSDGSYDLLVEFARTAPFPVRILRNAEPLGVAANFTQVVQWCAGDLIALCDHDDVWLPDRLVASEAAFADPDVVLTFSDATLIASDGSALPRTLWYTLGLQPEWMAQAPVERVFAALLARRVATGGTMTLRADVARWALPIATGWFQDEWLAQLASLRGRLQPIPQPLMQYRQHRGNAVGAQSDGLRVRLGKALRGGRRDRLQEQVRQLEILAADVGTRPGVPDWARANVTDRLLHARARHQVTGGPGHRLAAVWREWRTGRYAGDAMGTWSALQDLLG
jgi:hypothetical protein